jgi:TPR repeat protein
MMRKAALAALLVAALAAPGHAETPAEACDRLAASPADPARRAEPVPLDAVDTPAAIAACAAASEALPGEPRYRYQLGRARDAAGNVAEALMHYEVAAEAGYPAAAFALAQLYDEAGADADPAMIAAWYAKAASAGNPAAQGALGTLFETGRGVARDPAAARTWYGRAAEAGDVPAMADLARLMQDGIGAPRDLAKAEHWLRRAADTGDAASANDLAWMLAVDGRSLAEAQGLAESAVVAMPDDPAPIDTLGLVRLRQGRAAEAEALFRQAVALQPDFGPFHARLGDALAAAGHADAARAAWQAALDLTGGGAVDEYGWDRDAVAARLQELP